ncbi:MAG: cohesin domain-containing protein [Candidatus Pacebacteria bacterium]|nr:cohesin domain-containing protein [Candidatus Paceibacterota bacterium]
MPRTLLYINIFIFVLSGFSLFFFYEKWEPVIFENKKEDSIIIQSPAKTVFIEDVEVVATTTKRKISLNEDFIIPIGIDNLESSLSSAFIKLVFDPSKITVSEVKKGNIFIGDEYHSEFNYDVDNKKGVVITGIDVLTPIASDKHGTIIEITANAKRLGESVIEFKEVEIFDFSGERVNYSINPIELIID